MSYQLPCRVWTVKDRAPSFTIFVFNYLHLRFYPHLQSLLLWSDRTITIIPYICVFELIISQVFDAIQMCLSPRGNKYGRLRDAVVLEVDKR